MPERRRVADAATAANASNNPTADSLTLAEFIAKFGTETDIEELFWFEYDERSD